MLSVVVPAILESRDESGDVSEILVVASILPGKQGVNGVVEVIAPLSIDTIAAMGRIVKKAGVVQIAFGNQVKLAPDPLGELRGGIFEFSEEMTGAEVEDSVNSVESQCIEVELLEPVHGILAEKPSHFVAALPIEIDRLTPDSSVTIGKVRTVCIKVVAFRTEMVVDDIEGDGEATAMRRIDQSL